jgi:hypothetical protein
VPTPVLNEEQKLAEKLRYSDPDLEVYEDFPGVDVGELALESARKQLEARASRVVETPKPIEKTVYVVTATPLSA